MTLIQLWRRRLEGKNLETGLISTHSLVHLQKQRLHYCTSTFYKRPAPTWRVSSISRALHWYCRGQGLESRTSLNFSRLSFRNCKSCVYNFDDLLTYNSSTKSQTTTVKLSTGQNLIGVATMRVARASSLSRRPVHVLRKWRKQKSNFTVVVRPSSRDNLMATFQFGIIKYWPLLVCTDGHYVEVSGAEN